MAVAADSGAARVGGSGETASKACLRALVLLDVAANLLGSTLALDGVGEGGWGAYGSSVNLPLRASL